MSYENKGSMAATVTVSREPDRSGNWVCDGAADDVQINAALAYVNVLGGGSVFLGEGDYDITATLSVPVDVMLHGAGFNTVLLYDAGGNCITVTGDNVKIRDLKIDIVAGAGAGGTRPNCILADTRNNIEITKVWLVGDETVADDGNAQRQCGIVFSTVTDSKIALCRSENHMRYGIRTIVITNNIVSGNTCQGNTQHGISLTSSPNNMLSGNTCQGNTQHGILLSSCLDNTLTGNLCNGNTQRGIGLDSTSDNNVVTGNTCQGNTEYGIRLNNSDSNTLTGNVCNGNTLMGILLIATSDNNMLSGNTCQGNTQHGIQIDDSSNNPVVGNTCNENDSGDTGSFDGINITDTSSDNLIHANTCNDNDRFGINIDDVLALRNWVKNNQLRGNTSGAFNDATANLTKLAVVTFQFIAGGDVEGTAVWASFVSATASAKGWSVAGADDWAVALSHLPLELQQIVRFKIWAVALGAPINAGGQMHLEIIMNAGADNLAFTTEPVALANFDGATTDYINTDVVHWVVDSGDDADIGSMVGGMSLEVKVIYETGSDPDGATNAVFRAVEIEYV